MSCSNKKLYKYEIYAGLPYVTGLTCAGLAYPESASLPYLGRKRCDANADASVFLASGAPNVLPVGTILL